MWREFELESITNMNTSDVTKFIFDIRSKRLNRTTFGVTGKIILLDDSTEKYDVYMCFKLLCHISLILIFFNIDRSNYLP